MKPLRSFNKNDIPRCVKAILSFDDETLKSYIRHMYDIYDKVEGPTSDRAIHVCEYIIYKYLVFKEDADDEIELIYYMCVDLNNNLKEIAEKPEYVLEESCIRDALIRFNEFLGYLKAKNKPDPVDYY